MKLQAYATRTELSNASCHPDFNIDALHAVLDLGIVYKVIDRHSKQGFSECGRFGQNIFPGALLFQLRATHGLPLGDALNLIIDGSRIVDWVGFIEEARKNQWWDFQIVEAVEQAFIDADFFRPTAEKIITRMKCWILENPL
jgi:hypothetical protein